MKPVRFQALLRSWLEIGHCTGGVLEVHAETREFVYLVGPSGVHSEMRIGVKPMSVPFTAVHRQGAELLVEPLYNVEQVAEFLIKQG